MILKPCFTKACRCCYLRYKFQGQRSDLFLWGFINTTLLPCSCLTSFDQSWDVKYLLAPFCGNSQQDFWNAYPYEWPPCQVPKVFLIVTVIELTLVSPSFFVYKLSPHSQARFTRVLGKMAERELQTPVNIWKSAASGSGRSEAFSSLDCKIGLIVHLVHQGARWAVEGLE